MTERRTVDFVMLALKNKYPIPDGWELGGWEVKNYGTPAAYVQYWGAVVTETFKRGKHKGRKNWAKKNRYCEMHLPLLDAEMDAVKAKWSAETGMCHRCTGNGTWLSGWSADEGYKYVVCKRCDGTGKEP